MTRMVSKLMEKEFTLSKVEFAILDVGEMEMRRMAEILDNYVPYNTQVMHRSVQMKGSLVPLKCAMVGLFLMPKVMIG